ncbi:pre-toxin TG domain-containing protein [Clostridium kluyveri]|uniref:Pre-toxin TG domain-containing protein n=1 Tax=Clostridium kluyveri TaxID=1534 RepID=A0A1L5F9G4_CLOKL|nr:pre-toxin TG domain-containing protein [Clostridium kluyveri]APM39658.1 hypothetical protein BS101_13365 [Clostridium kluyveri]
MVKTIKKLRDSKLQDIRIDNNVGIQGERPASIFDMNTKVSDGINKDKIGLEDLLGFGRISMAMHQEYEQIKSQIDAYNASLPKYSSENASKFLPDFISKLIFDSEIDKEKINSCDDYIKKMVTSSDFDYETNGERTASIAADFIPVFGQLKMLGEIVEGKDLVSGKHYSTGDQLFGLGTLGAGSLLGKIYKGIKAGMSPEVEEAAGKLSNGTVFAMNGAGGASEIEKLAKNITKKIVGRGKEASEGAVESVHVKASQLPEGSQWQRNVLNSFEGGNAVEKTYGEGTTLYRVGGKNGCFWSLNPPPATEYEWRVKTAIKQEFCNDGSTLYKMTVPKGSSISGLDGTVGPQGMGLYGGAHQIYIDFNAVPERWIQTSPINFIK